MADVKKLTPERRKQIVQDLTDNYELLNLQALIAERRAALKKANLEELIYAIKIEELKTPPKPQTEDGKS